MEFLIVCAVIAALIIDGIIAIEFQTVARLKGYMQAKYFWYCFLFTFAGYALVISLPNMSKKHEHEENNEELPEI